eukprot:snap_masked-scaffold2_size2283618-processed-gene-21.35 protein:Tk00092 transcript:snap_masked-scaffold2_size2283618-processed-gene-21.35-mRNA-1 annotation:"2-keto-4-pentenoate hydratase 2-oxohepta-3-ene- -dioic acid hydratase"
MKLLRVGEVGSEKPCLLDDTGVLRDLSAQVPDIDGSTLSPTALERLRALDPTSLPAISGEPRVGACVGNIGKVMCIGLNYADHAAESNLPVPDHPILFMKATSAVVGPNDTVRLPRGSTAADWEVELAVVIGTAAKYVSEADALKHVAGYCVMNDISERDFQSKLSGQWTKGPWMVTADEIDDPQALDMSLDVNGVRRQTGNTRTQIFNVAQVIAHLSTLFTLHPGDIISTGTPPGVGMGIKPEPIYLKGGDRLELSIAGLGTQQQSVEADT